MKCWRIAVLVIACAVASGCATQLVAPKVSEDALHREQVKQHALVFAMNWKRQVRLLNVGSRVRVASAALCNDDVSPVWGMLFGQPADIPREYRRPAARTFQRELAVWHVVPGLPAYRAGLRAHDVIRKVNGIPVQKTEEVARRIKDASAVVSVEFERSARRYLATVQPAEGCAYPVQLVQEAGVNAFADGAKVMVTGGMMRFVESDAELALVVGHEIAHNTLGHLNRRRGNQIAGMVLGGLIDLGAALAGVSTGGAGIQAGRIAGSRAFSQDFEKEADYMGVYLAARAGYDVSNAADFWRRMAIEYPGSVKHNYMASHPSTPERSVGIERAVREVDRKRNRGLALVPRRKDMPADRGR